MSERDEALAERDELRSLLVRVINEGTDGTSNESVSMDFLRHVPSECASVKRKRDEARGMTEHQLLLKVGIRLMQAGCKSDGIIDSLDEIIRERDEAKEAFIIATKQAFLAQSKTREALRERDEARAAAKLAYSILAKVNRPSLEAAAAQSSIKHINNTPMEWLYSIIQNWKEGK